MYKFIIDGEKITSKAELYASAADQLPLPGWFGRNLDALYDTLTCDILPKDGVEAEIVSADALKKNLGGYADALISMLTHLAGEDKRLVLKITE